MSETCLDLSRGPYRSDEQRVVDYLAFAFPEIGAGPAPIGFLIASHAAVGSQLAQMKVLAGQLIGPAMPARILGADGHDPRLPPGRPHP